jgi:hypothetical protein
MHPGRGTVAAAVDHANTASHTQPTDVDARARPF